MSDYASSSSRPASPVGELPQIANSSRPYRFTWDAAHRRQGPGSVSETTEGRGDYFATAGHVPDDTLLQTGTQVGAFPAEWSSSIHGFHAISTVVNSPHKKSAPPKAHSALPAVPPADLPRVRRKDFDSYLRSVAPEWERFEKSVEQGREGAAQVNTHAASSQRSSSSIELPVSPRTPRPATGRPLPPLESVPQVYFEKGFNLGDPRTFNVVTEFSDQHEGFMLDDPASFSYAQPLIDKLSGHADTIEQHLVREISIRSTSFFAALSNLQDLQTESEQCLGRIKQLRSLLKEVDEKSAVKGLEVVRMEGRIRNFGKVRSAVGVVGNVVEMVSVARSLVGAGQWGEALDVVDELNALWNSGSHDNGTSGQKIYYTQPNQPQRKDGRRSPLPTVEESPPSSPPAEDLEYQAHSTNGKMPAPSIPISSLQAFASLPSNLRLLTMQIASSLTSEIVGVLKLDLLDRIDHGKPALNGMNGHSHGANGEPVGAGMQFSLKDKLRPLLQALSRTGGMREATVSWREVVLAEVRGVLKRHIPLFSLSDDDSPSPGASSTSEITTMEHSTFLDLARTMYERFLNCIEGLQAQNNIISEVLEGIRQSASFDMTTLKEDLADILSSAGELANARAAKVVGLRTEQHTALELKDFWTFFNVSWDFVVKSEVICRRMIVGLRGVVVSQSKTFIQAFHQTRLSQSAKLVEDELWNPAEVSPVTQHIVNLLVDASMRDPAEFSFNPPSSPIASPSSPALPSALSPSSPNPSISVTLNGATVQPSSPVPSPSLPPPPVHLQTPERTTKRRSAQSSPGKHLKIEDRNFFSVAATSEVLVLLSDYLRVIVNLPTLVTETMSRVIELLKAFNSRTCQVVLGAGAMRSAGLKNITAKHLALASQSLSIMISLIPYIRETFRRHFNPKQAVMLIEFDKLKRDYQEHQNEIHQKLIAIMGDRLSAHIRSLQAVKWDVPKEGVNEYMELLAKETTTLHKVLSRYLSVSVVEFVMSQVFAAINHRLSEEYAALELPSLEAKERLLVDARYLHEKLSSLKNVRAPTAMLEIVIQEKRVAMPQPDQSPQLPTSQSSQPSAQAQPHSNTASRFAHMFNRAALPRTTTVPSPVPRATIPVSAPLGTPTPDIEKALPVVSPSPEPSSQGLSPTPIQFPGLTNGHASPQPPTSPEPSQSGVLYPEGQSMSEEPENIEETEEPATAPEPPPPTPPKHDEDALGAPADVSKVEAGSTESVASPEKAASKPIDEPNGLQEEV